MAETPKTPPDKRLSEVPFGYQPVEFNQTTRCPSMEETKRKKDVWLIKVPFDFDAGCLSGQTIIMNGIQEISNSTSKENNDRFEIVSKPLDTSVPSSFKALLPSSNKESVWTAKNFKGNISIVKSLSVPIQDINLISEHQGHIEAPEIRARWKPFGYKQPYKAQMESQKAVDIKTEKESPKDKKKQGKRSKKGKEDSPHQKSNEILDKNIHIKDERTPKDKKKQGKRNKSKKGKEDSPHQKSNEIFDENIKIKVEQPSPQKDEEILQAKSNEKRVLFSSEKVTIKVEKNEETPRKKRKKAK